MEHLNLNSKEIQNPSADRNRKIKYLAFLAVSGASIWILSSETNSVRTYLDKQSLAYFGNTAFVSILRVASVLACLASAVMLVLEFVDLGDNEDEAELIL